MKNMRKSARHKNNLWQKVMSSVPKSSLNLGPYFTHQIRGNIKHVLMTFARYKFAARMIGENPKLTVLELGCNEGLGTLYFAQTTSNTVAVDFDEKSIKWAKRNLEGSNISFVHSDFLGKKFGNFNAVVSLDVIEHIDRKKELIFLSTIADNLKDEGFAIIGTPNAQASRYASEASRIGHVNLYDAERLKRLFLKRFNNVFIFSMNDEMVHTGFYPMAHYLICLSCCKK